MKKLTKEIKKFNDVLIYEKKNLKYIVNVQSQNLKALFFQK